MTQKELSYYEDAVGHEMNIIKILEESVKNISDNTLLEFLENELSLHNNRKDKLINLMENLVNE